MQEAMRRLDALTQQLIEAGQSGSGLGPVAVAHELGRIRQLLAQAPAVIPATCGGKTFFAADLEQPAVESAGD